MSVTDLRGAAAYGDEPSGDDFDAIFGSSAGPPDGRTPPQDHAAEQSVLGAMLLSKDAIADVVESIRGSDFYRPAHELLYDAIIDLYGRGEPADAVTLAAQLTRRGELGKVGGAPYLHTLVASVPIATNASYYADIVREKAILRRLVDAGTKIAQLGFSGEGQVDDVVDRAQAEIYSVTDKRTSEDYAPLSEIMAATLDEIEAISAHDGGLAGVPTGFADLDDLTNGLHPGQMVIVAARPALGKALALDTALATPTGWTTMGQVEVGDQLMGADGRPTTVTAATPVMSGRACYRMTFSDGSRIVADAHHQWLTATGSTGTSVRTTEQLATALRVPDGHRHRAMHALPNTRPLQLAEAQLPIRPYTLGVWLGDAHPASARRTAVDPEIAMYVEADGDEGAGAEQSQTLLRSIGVPGSRQIPTAYLRASERQRRGLLSGLLDAAGTVTSTGDVEFAAGDQRLVTDVHELAVGLGHRCRQHEAQATGRRATPCVWHVLTITPVDDVFRLSRKATEHKERCRGSGAPSARRYVTRVEAIPSEPVRCVEVDNADHLYLAGHSMIPTHNSTLGLDLCRAASIKHGMASVIFSLEMSRTEITMRLLSAEARIAINHMRNGHMNDDDWARLARKMGEVSEAPLFIDDSPNMTMMEIRAKARRLKQRHDLRLIVVDYLQLMTSGRKVESRQLEVSEFSRQMKLLAKELEIPIVAISQLNRGAEQRTDKRPFLSDLRESGCLTADARLMRADTGSEITLGELVASGARDIPVWSLDERLELVPRTLTHAFPSGVKDVFRVRLASGRQVDATANHPFLTYDGWQPLGDLAPGDRVGVPRHVPAPIQTTPWDDDEVVLLAHLLGERSFVRRQPIRYASTDEVNLTTVAEAAARRFGISAIRDGDPVAGVTTLRLPAPYRLTSGRRNPIAAWLDSLGLFGLRRHEKFVPSDIFGLPTRQVALFLRHLWATDGSVRWDAKAGLARISYASTSRSLVDDVARLLLRFNIVARIKRVTRPGYRDGWHLLGYGGDNQMHFCNEMGTHGARSARFSEVADQLSGRGINPNLDTVPVEEWNRVRGAVREREMSHREFAAANGLQFCGSTMSKCAPARTRGARVATILDDADLEVLATNDIYWDSIVEVESIGEREVFDATVLGTHNFVANGIALHNSLEQDADLVVLLHREDAYERESTRPGEADLIVAKHRSGPTDTIVVAFQGHYSRFVDMQQT